MASFMIMAVRYPKSMKTTLQLVSSGLVAIALTFTADLGVLSQVAEEKQSSQSFQLPLELDQLAYFQGSWRCEQPAKASSSEPIVLAWQVERDLNDFWYVGHAEEMASESNPEPVNSQEFLGYDAVSRRFVRLAVVGNGQLLNLTSLGWQDEQFVWEGTVTTKDQLISLREIVTRENEDKFAATYFVLDAASDEWQPVINETCERQA